MTNKDKTKRIEPKNPEATGDTVAADDDKTADRKTSAYRPGRRKTMGFRGN
jgi:hypothetical protein